MTLVHLAIGLRKATEHQELQDIEAKSGPTANITARYVEYRPGMEPWKPKRTTYGKFDDGVDIFGPGTARKLDDLPEDATEEDVDALLMLPRKTPPVSSAVALEPVDTLAAKVGRLPPAALGCLGPLVDYLIELSGSSRADRLADGA